MKTALMRRRPGIGEAQCDRLCELMIRAVPDCTVEGYEGLADGLKLPDENDRHVVIVTLNVKDLPGDELERLNIEAKSPDDFILDQIGIDDRKVWACLQQIADSRNNPPEAIEDVMDQLENSGLIESMALLRSS
jgi:hypothetical protein